MSQKPRTPEHFPRMRYRARKRHLWTIVDLAHEPPYICVGPIRDVQRMLKKLWESR